MSISAVTPPARHIDDPDLPTTSSFAVRVACTRLLNQELAHACREWGLGFVDATAAYVDQAGGLRPAVSDGLIHIRPELAGPLLDACRSATRGAA